VDTKLGTAKPRPPDSHLQVVDLNGSPHWTISATGSSVRQPEVAVLRLCWDLAEDLLDMETGAATTFAGYKTLRDSRQGDPVTAMWSQE